VLRIAKDSPLIAGSDPQQHAMETDGQTVTYRYTDPWALLTFMQRHRDPESTPRQEGRSQLLKFEFPLRPQALNDVGLIPPGGKARVYLRVTLTPAGKKTPLAWPAVFPSRAPEWSLP
jgi:type VI secretion system protein ImpL